MTCVLFVICIDNTSTWRAIPSRVRHLATVHSIPSYSRCLLNAKLRIRVIHARRVIHSTCPRDGTELRRRLVEGQLLFQLLDFLL